MSVPNSCLGSQDNLQKRHERDGSLLELLYYIWGTYQ